MKTLTITGVENIKQREKQSGLITRSQKSRGVHILILKSTHTHTQ